MNPIPLSLYIHFPWCIHKCPYCDFNSHAVKAQTGIPEDIYIQSLLRDLELELPDIWGRSIHTLFMGGGTPSLISAHGIQTLLEGLRQRLRLRPNMEITLEANPGTFEQERFSAYRKAGITRLSIGIQSFNAAHLKTLERIHNGNEAHCAAEIAINAGFDNFNLDLMHGLPTQTLDEAMSDLKLAIAHQATHLSWYQLTIEPNTLFHHQTPELPDDDELAAIQEAGVELLQQHGYEQYEVSAYAKPGFECQHNRNYWEFGDYVGIGAGAHGKLTVGDEIKRYHKHKHPDAYIKACQQGTPKAKAYAIEAKDRVFEFMLNALRLKQGFAKPLFTERTLLDEALLTEGLYKARQKGLLRENRDQLTSSQQGWNFLNETIECFLEE